MTKKDLELLQKAQDDNYRMDFIRVVIIPLGMVLSSAIAHLASGAF